MNEQPTETKSMTFEESEFEGMLLNRYNDYLKNWENYLVPADVQEFSSEGSVYIKHSFYTFMRYLQIKWGGGVKYTKKFSLTQDK